MAFAGGEQRRADASVRLGAEETLAAEELIGGAQEPVCDTPLNRSRQAGEPRPFWNCGARDESRSRHTGAVVLCALRASTQCTLG